MRFLLPFSILLLAVLACSSSNRTTTNQSGPIRGLDSQGRLTAEGKIYLGAAGGYFVSTHEYNKQLAIRMLDSGRGRATLGEVRTEIENRRRIENAAFYGDYQSAVVPSEFADLDAQINQIHDGYEAAFDEYLEYWNSHDRAHIQSGSARFQNALKQADLVVKQLNQRLDQIKR